MTAKERVAHVRPRRKGWVWSRQIELGSVTLSRESVSRFDVEYLYMAICEIDPVFVRVALAEMDIEWDAARVRLSIVASHVRCGCDFRQCRAQSRTRSERSSLIFSMTSQSTRSR
jgi:hypothetical protein